MADRGRAATAVVAMERYDGESPRLVPGEVSELLEAEPERHQAGRIRETMRNGLVQALQVLISQDLTSPDTTVSQRLRIAELCARYGIGAPRTDASEGARELAKVLLLPDLQR